MYFNDLTDFFNVLCNVSEHYTNHVFREHWTLLNIKYENEKFILFFWKQK